MGSTIVLCSQRDVEQIVGRDLPALMPIARAAAEGSRWAHPVLNITFLKGLVRLRVFRRTRIVRTVVWLMVTGFLLAQPIFAVERVTLGDGRVSFEPPSGFKQLTKEEIAKKYFRGNPPHYVFGNQSLSVNVAVTFSNANVSPKQIPEYKAAMEEMFPRMIPGLKWLTRELIEVEGRRWFHLEMTSYAIDTDIHNHLYATSFDGKLLIFGFNSTVKEYSRMKEALEKSFRSIKFNEN